MQSIKSFTPRLGLNKNHRKEGNAFYSYSIIDLNNGQEVAVIRLYNSATGSRNYACLWVLKEGHHATGSGQAGGYGYHRTSAAAQLAFKTAGIVFGQPIDGGGDWAIREAMRCLAGHLGIKRWMLHTANP